MKSENEKLRGLLDRTVTEVGRTITPELRAAIDAALSQLAEPVCDTCHGQGEVWTGENQSFGYMSMQPPEPIMEACPECGGDAEPAPAQDEREAVLKELKFLMDAAWLNNKTMAEAIFDAGFRRPAQTEQRHPDDAAVDRFAAAMKAKLAAARAKGRGGWDDPNVCSVEFLAQLLVEHLAKGNAGTFEDVANFAMMLHQRGAEPKVLADAALSAKGESHE